MIRVFQRNTVHKVVPTDADAVIAYAPLPANGRVNGLWLDVHVVSSGQVSVLRAIMYGIKGYVVPVIDPDAGITPQLLWDQSVPKSDAVGQDVLDFDTGSADTDPVLEPGAVNWNELFEVNQAPFNFFTREKVLTFANGRGGHLEGTPDVYQPADGFQTKVSKRMEVKVPSYAMVGFSSPAWDLNRTVFMVPDSDEDWAQLQYIEDVLERGMMHILGLTEAGAETPWIEAATLLRDLLENGEEDTANSWAQSSYNVFCRATWDVSYQGRMEIGPITSR